MANPTLVRLNTFPLMLEPYRTGAYKSSGGTLNLAGIQTHTCTVHTLTRQHAATHSKHVRTRSAVASASCCKFCPSTLIHSDARARVKDMADLHVWQMQDQHLESKLHTCSSESLCNYGRKPHCDRLGLGQLGLA